MDTPQCEPISSEDCFQFGCHPNVICFNQCCRDLNQALTPYDIVRLKNALQMTTQQFITRYASIHMGPATGLPVASLRFSDRSDRSCPFVSPTGCRVYNHRPTSCRLYPLARAVQRSKSNGRLDEHYALLKEAHCRGFGESQTQTVHTWIAHQGLADYFRMNDALMEVIALKNRLLPGPLSPELAQFTRLALYNVEGLKQHAADGRLPGTDAPELMHQPSIQDDAQWLLWGLGWIRQVLFGNQQ